MTEPPVITSRGSVAYLVRRGFVRSQDVVDGRVTVLDLSRRNRNLAVICEPGPSLLLKQSEPGADFVALEASAYRQLRGRDDPELERYLVGCIDFDENWGVLVLELEANARTVREGVSRRGTLPLYVATAMGCALGMLHRKPVQSASSVAPGAFSLPLPPLELLWESSRASHDLLRLLQSQAEIAERAATLALGWRTTSMIHGDARWDNFVYAPAVGSTRRGRVKLIDWETLDVGDPRWDVGFVLGDFLLAWLEGMPIAHGLAPPEMVGASRRPLERFHPALERFLLAYCETVGLGDGDIAEFVVASTAYCGVRLLHSCYEACQMTSGFTAFHLLELQLAANIMSDPESAATNLFGFRR